MVGLEQFWLEMRAVLRLLVILEHCKLFGGRAHWNTLNWLQLKQCFSFLLIRVVSFQTVFVEFIRIRVMT